MAGPQKGAPAGRGVAVLLACVGLAGWLLWVAVLRPAGSGLLCGVSGHGASIAARMLRVLCNSHGEIPQ